MPSYRMNLLPCLTFLLAASVSTATGEPVDSPEAIKQRLFERVFGDAVRLDPEIVERVKALEPGERLWIDSNGDGKNDEVWYIDTALRHTDRARPVLVRAIDEDGDLDEHQGPDRDSDLYVVDWGADGTVDVVLDYQDNRGDNAVDEMTFYFFMPRHHYFGENALGVWWGRDDGGDNLLWYDVDYTYYQHLCQYRCHFSGDETFVAFGLTEESDVWLSAWENPFLFYDTDGDRCSEVVLRIEGKGNQIRAIRYSFDIDDDAYGRRTHDYDFSITAIADEDQPVILPSDGVESTTLRGIPTQPWLHRDRAEAFVQEAVWHKALLTWDEINANTDHNVQRDPNERWEGVIAHSSEHFPQIGGPACSPHNKRNEVMLEPGKISELYWGSDRKLHLRGASKGWVLVDYDLDGQVDARYDYIDENGDGVFDRRDLDLDGNGEVDLSWPMSELTELPPFNFRDRDFLKTYRARLLSDLAMSQRFVDVAKAALPDAIDQVDPVERFFLHALDDWMPQAGLGRWIRRSPAGARYYVELVRDRLYYRLQQTFHEHAAWHDIEKAYADGEYDKAAALIERRILERDHPIRHRATYESFEKRLYLELSDTRAQPRLDQPIVLPVRAIREKAPDFNPRNCAVVPDRPWIDWHRVAHQIDTVDPAEGPVLSFVSDTWPADGTANNFYLYYSPKGSSSADFVRKTGTAEDWVPPNIGWESDRCAYRAYWGQFDFFGKKTGRLIYDDIGATSYHRETDWGIDALHVGETSGIGGLTLYVDGRPYPVQNPAGKGDVKFSKRILTQGPVRAAIEITAGNVVPDLPELEVRMLCLIYAGRQESEVRVTVSGSDRPVTLAPGLVKLPRERFFADRDAGTFGSWGWQENAIGEIGMGLIILPDMVEEVIDLEKERRIACRPAGGTLRYWIIGDWRRGRQHPVAPTIDNWHWELNELAGQLLSEPMVSLGPPEDIP